MLIYLALCTVIGKIVLIDGSAEPCSNATYTVLDQEWRNIHEQADSSGGHCDQSIDQRWYRFINNGGDDMPVYAPVRGDCGTNNPVWLDGSLPTVAEGQVTRSVCMVTPVADCEYSWDIHVKNCSGYYVYFLPPSAGCPSAYCIGTKEKCAVGLISTTGYEPCHYNGSTPLFNGAPTMTVEVGSKPLGKGNVTIYLFNCSAPTVSDSEGHSMTQFTTLYRYEWIMKGFTLINQIVTGQRFKYITEDDLKKVFYSHFPSQAIMGNNLTCRVSVGYSTFNGSYSDIAETSYFLGIQILTTSITLYKDTGANSAYVQLKSTIPILCQDPQFSACFLYLQTLIPTPPTGNTLSCQGKDYLDDVVFQNHIDKIPCYFQIPAANWTQTVNFKVLASSLRGYTSDTRESSWKIRLQVINSTSQPLWRFYTIGQVTVFVIDNSNVNGYVPNSICYASNDPHMKTFDNKYYEMQQPGEYVMYRHNTLPILVHGYFVSYNWYSGVCGFAVQSGSDLIVHDNCNGNQPKRIRVYGCSDYGLKEDYDGSTHTITLPTGTKVELNSWSIVITASRLDFQQTSGLCGTFDGDGTNDMVLSDGSYSTVLPQARSIDLSYFWQHYDDFAQSWRISSTSTSLYFGQTLQSLPSWTQREENYCVCRSADDKAPSCSYTPNAPDAYCATYQSVTKDPNYSACLEYKKRSTTSTDNVEYQEPTEFPKAFDTAVVVNTNWKNGWNEQKATNFCTTYLKSTPQYSSCSTFEVVDLQTRINTCVLDIKISGGTDFSSAQKNIMLDVCENVLTNNQSMWTMNNESGIVEPPSMLSTFCPSDCSGHGTCINGSCNCNAGYTDSDCSGNLTHVPALFPLPTNGLCDSSQRACLSTTVFADQFIDSSNISCLLLEFVVSATGKISTSFTSKTSAMFYHDQKVACTLPPVQSNMTDNTLGYGYKVSVANTANAYSTPKDLVVYDGNCVACSTDQVCFIKNGVCIIEGVCYKDQDLKLGSTSLKCDSSVNKWVWTNVSADSDTTNTPERSSNGDSTQTILPAVLVPVLVVLVTAVAVVAVVIMKSKTHAKRTVSSDWTPFRPESASPYQGISDHAYQMEDSPFDKETAQIPRLSTIMQQAMSPAGGGRAFLPPISGKQMPL